MKLTIEQILDPEHGATLTIRGAWQNTGYAAEIDGEHFAKGRGLTVPDAIAAAVDAYNAAALLQHATENA